METTEDQTQMETTAEDMTLMDTPIPEEKNRTILIALLKGGQNLESCLKLAKTLEEKGFKIVLAVDNKTAPLLGDDHTVEVYDTEPSDDWSKKLDLNCLNTTPALKLKNFSYHLVLNDFEFVRKCEPFNERLVHRLRPELIIVESLICSPALTNSGIPWIWLNFSPPNLCKNDRRLPPGWSGLQFNKQAEFSEFREEWSKTFRVLKTRIDNWCASKGVSNLADNLFHPHSPYLNFYVHPTEMDYKLGNTWELKEWQQIDCLLKRRTGVVGQKMAIPASIASKPGKLIYLSMGSYASVDLMKRLVAILSESKHKFIVSKGPFHREYELADNMWGEEDVPLDDWIRTVVLVITCGDSQTITKSLLYARPMIVLPLFGDQLDNRTRLRECSFGWGLDPFTCTKETLLCSINSNLDDKPLMRRQITIAKAMDSSDSCRKMVDDIEKMLNRVNEVKPDVPEPEPIQSLSLNDIMIEA